MRTKEIWIQTWSGLRFSPLDPQRYGITIGDIAHALAYTCRFGGHCSRYYSVAEHSVYVSHHVPEGLALTGLLHDAAEAYLGDVPRPLKPMWRNYKTIERKVLQAICVRFSAEYPDERVKRIDNAILATEAHVLMGQGLSGWHLPENPLEISIAGWGPEEAERRFLERYHQIKHGRS